MATQPTSVVPRSRSGYADDYDSAVSYYPPNTSGAYTMVSPVANSVALCASSLMRGNSK